eukprot:NODE_8_length_66115_cov_0.981823.p50 type:complete len:140 gc:universal NODE_8_length_66115_cov_0.981823:58894-59313(+)
MLIEADHESTSGFSKSIPVKHRKPPIRLTIRPDHAMQLGLQKVNFTPARFDTINGKEEKYIVSSTGNYLIAWSLKKAKLGRNDYQIKKYSETIVGEQFHKPGQVVVALSNQLVLANKRNFMTPKKIFADRDSVTKSYNK